MCVRTEHAGISEDLGESSAMAGRGEEHIPYLYAGINDNLAIELLKGPPNVKSGSNATEMITSAANLLNGPGTVENGVSTS